MFDWFYFTSFTIFFKVKKKEKQTNKQKQKQTNQNEKKRQQRKETRIKKKYTNYITTTGHILNILLIMYPLPCLKYKI